MGMLTDSEMVEALIVNLKSWDWEINSKFGIDQTTGEALVKEYQRLRRMRMSSVYRDTKVTLTEEDKAILKPAIEKCIEIARDCNNEDMFVDAGTVFMCIYDNYKNGEVPTVVEIFE